MEVHDSLVKKTREIMINLREFGIGYDISRSSDVSVTLDLSIPFLIEQNIFTNINISNGLLPGLSYKILMTALISKPIIVGENISSFAAFFQQLSLTLFPFYFIFDFDLMQVIMRHGSLYSDDVMPDCRGFIESIPLISTKLEKSLAKLKINAISQQDARFMADLLSESYYKVMAE